MRMVTSCVDEVKDTDNSSWFRVKFGGVGGRRATSEKNQI